MQVNQIGEPFMLATGVKHGCVPPVLLIVTVLEAILPSADQPHLGLRYRTQGRATLLPLI